MKVFYGLLCSIALCSAVFAGGYSNQSYNFNKNNSYIVKEKIVEFDADYFLETDGYYSVGDRLKNDKIREENNEKAYLRGKIDALNEIIKQLKENGGQDGGGNVEPNPEPQKPVDTLEAKVLDVFSRNRCLSCHGGGKDQGDLALTDSNGKLLSIDFPQKVNIVYRSEATHLEDGDARMPQGGKVMSGEDVAVLKSWMHKNMKELIK